MPLNLVDPTVQPVGAGIPNSPLASMFGKAVNAYGSTFPSALDRSQIQYHNAEAAKIQQQLGAAGQLANIFTSALNPKPAADPNAAPVESPRPSPEFIGPEPGAQPMHTPSPDDIMRSSLPQLASAMQAGGHIENAPQIARMMAAYLPGASAQVDKAAHGGGPSAVDMAMLGSGESAESTPYGFALKNQAGYTAEQKNRTNKINEIMRVQGVDMPTAEGLTDGVLDLTTDQAGNRVLINKATNASKLLYSMATGPTIDGRGGADAPSAPPSPGAAPVSGGKPLNNPFNLRPVGATTGFRQFDTPEQGMLAGLNDLSIKLSGQSQALGGKTPTVRNVISAWSPLNENDTPRLIAAAAARMKVDPDAPLNMTHLMPLAEAILQQEQGGSKGAPVTPGAAAPVAAAPTGFKMNAGDLGLPFDKMYGGSAVAGRALHTAASFVGGQDADPALAAFGKLNTLKNGLVSAMSTMPGRASNEGMQRRLLEQFPETDSNLLEMQNGVEQGGINPTDAETKFNQGIEQGAALYEQASEALKNPMLDAKTRDAYQTVKSTLQKTFLQTLPGGKYAEFLKSVGEAPPAGQPATPDASNLEKGKALTTPGAYKNVNDVVQAAKAGTLTRAEAKKILSSQFGVQ